MNPRLSSLMLAGGVVGLMAAAAWAHGTDGDAINVTRWGQAYSTFSFEKQLHRGAYTIDLIARERRWTGRYWAPDVDLHIDQPWGRSARFTRYGNEHGTFLAPAAGVYRFRVQTLYGPGRWTLRVSAQGSLSSR
jgi:hypothetical protein